MPPVPTQALQDPATDSAPAPRRARKSILVAGIAAMFLGAAALAAWLFVRYGMPVRVIGAASIEATTVDVTARVPGRVLHLVAHEGQQVRAGSVLAELEPQEADAQVAAARAVLAQAAAQVLEAQLAVVAQQQAADAQIGQAAAQLRAAGTAVPQSEAALAIAERTSREAVTAATARLRAAEAQVESVRSARTTAERDLARQKALFSAGAVAADQVDAAQTKYDTLVAQARASEEAVAQARADVATARANLMQVRIQQRAVEAAQAAVAHARATLEEAESGYTVVAQQRQLLAAAQASFSQARANLTYAGLVAADNDILAPCNGLIQTRNVEEGEVLPAGAALYTVIDPTDLWVRIYVREDVIGLVKIGQRARITIDTLPGEVFTGRVTQISDQPEFTTVNVQTKEDRIKLVFGVKVQVADPAHRLQPGMPARVEVLIGAARRDAR
ncbi:MAG TPA: HlyD family efflux transporter periplasmic adaptor subunit [bacterium]|nr:HlyD family efflux transporter periplasmic adaptor subunit [bacterium]